MEETKTKEDLKITAVDLKDLQLQQNRHFGEVWKPGSVLDKFEDALNQLSESQRKILYLYHVKNKTFDMIARELTVPHFLMVDEDQVEIIYEESMEILEGKLGFSWNEIDHLSNFKDLQQKTLKVINILCS